MNERFKTLRLDRGLTVEQMGVILNVSSSAISLMEHGKRTITDRTVTDLVRAFHINKDWLIKGEGKMYQDKTKEVIIAEITADLFHCNEDDPKYKLITAIHSMSDDEINAFSSFIRLANS